MPNKEKKYTKCDINNSGVFDRFLLVALALQSKYPEYKNDSDFAEAIGIAKQSFSNYKNNNRKPTLNAIYSMKRRFSEVDMNYIFTGKGSCFIGDSQEVLDLKEQIKILNAKIDVYKDIIKDK